MRVLRFSALCAALAATFGSLQAQSVPQRIEYFFDTDPGHGKATAVQSVKAGDNQLTFSTAGLQEGAHVLYVRSQDNNGAWSATTARPLFVIKKRPTGVRSLEYFLDTDPGYGKATRATIGGEGATLLLEPNTTETVHTYCTCAHRMTGATGRPSSSARSTYAPPIVSMRWNISSTATIREPEKPSA